MPVSGFGGTAVARLSPDELTIYFSDSLDLYELVMELEDTYGVSVPEEEAASIETVGQAVDFVARRLGAGA